MFSSVSEMLWPSQPTFPHIEGQTEKIVAVLDKHVNNSKYFYTINNSMPENITHALTCMCVCVCVSTMNNVACCIWNVRNVRSERYNWSFLPFMSEVCSSLKLQLQIQHCCLLRALKKEKIPCRLISCRMSHGVKSRDNRLCNLQCRYTQIITEKGGRHLNLCKSNYAIWGY